MKILFLYLFVIFALLDPDPDPATQINADTRGSGSTTLGIREKKAWLGIRIGFNADLDPDPRF